MIGIETAVLPFVLAAWFCGLLAAICVLLKRSPPASTRKRWLAWGYLAMWSADLAVVLYSFLFVPWYGENSPPIVTSEELRPLVLVTIFGLVIPSIWLVLLLWPTSTTQS